MGAGKRIRAGETVDHEDYAMVVFVSKKKPLSALAEEDKVPSELGGVVVDVVDIGVVRALTTTRRRPALGGISIGHKDITAGTLGSVVYDKTTNKKLILSNNHVIANSNSAKEGDDIYQPGPHDGGTSRDTIANLGKFVEIKFGGEMDWSDCPIGDFFAKTLSAISRLFNRKTRLEAVVYAEDEENLVDAALGIPTSDDIVSDELFKLGFISGISPAAPEDAVTKSGRTTGVTNGTIQYVDAEVEVSYGVGKTAYFVDQILTTNISAGGDSGSVVCKKIDGQLYATGLLFAGSETVTVLNRIEHVVDLLNIKFTV